MNSKAFTLIELLVVVAIIGILAAVGVVAYNGYTSAAKKRVTQANHNIIYKTMVNEIKKCEIDSSGGLLNVNGKNLLNCSDILTSQNNYGKVTSSMSTYFNSIIENAYTSTINLYQNLILPYLRNIGAGYCQIIYTPKFFLNYFSIFNHF